MTAEAANRSTTRATTRANFIKEAERIQVLALRGATTVRRLGPIILFCANRDAWLLDPEDGLARCVMSQGEKLPLGIEDYGMQFGVRWNADFRIEGDQFLVGQFGRGAACVVTGYPTKEIKFFASSTADN